jgi:hypothetical protein
VRQHDPRREPTPIAHPGDVAVLAHPVEHAPLAHGFALRGASVVTVGDDFDDAAALLESGARVRVGRSDAGGRRGDVARLVGAPGTPSRRPAGDRRRDPRRDPRHRRAALRPHLPPSLSRRSHGWHDDEWVDYLGGSGRELCWFPEPVGARDCYRADFADPLLLHAAFPEVGIASAPAGRRGGETGSPPVSRC